MTAERSVSIVQEPATVIIVDDSAIGLRLLERTLRAMSGIEVKAFDHPVEALEWARTEPYDLLITDLEMPVMHGLELIEACRADPRTADVPIMAITASTERELRQRALQLGALDFLNKPLDPDEVRARTRNMVTLAHAQRKLANRSKWLADEVQRATAGIVARERETILRLSRAAEYRDWETGQHIMRIAEYSRLIAAHLELAPQLVEDIALAAPLHDIGKIGIPDYILLKPDRLDQEEFALMQQHTVMGHEILRDSASGLLQLGAEIALTHHEKFDGTGYPRRIAGEAIPLPGRIVAVADVFDAVTSRRPYKAAFPVAEARTVIVQGSGKNFDPQCVDAFLHEWDAVLAAKGRFADSAANTDLLDKRVPALAS